MAKIKTHKASAKRFHLTGSGKIKIYHSDHRHNLGQKTAKRKRHLRGSSMIDSAQVTANVRKLICK